MRKTLMMALALGAPFVATSQATALDWDGHYYRSYRDYDAPRAYRYYDGPRVVHRYYYSEPRRYRVYRYRSDDRW